MFSAVGCTLPVDQSEMLATETPISLASALLDKLLILSSSVNIAIANGRISEISFKILESHNTYPNDHITASGIEIKVKFSNFGTAKVNIPKDAMDAIKAYVAQN